VGEGTTFSLYFPALSANEIARPKPASPPARMPVTQDDGVILLVEDEAPVRAFASRALRLRGYTVLEAETAEATLKTLEDEELNIDVFVTDVVMPGMDGPTWVQQALRDRPGVRVVFVSGYAEDSFGEAQTKIPNSVFLPKPFSLSDLTETVHKQLH
jgi:two-component system, cell cycle sensor histidine kinase and response regulator CckA